MSFFFFSFSLRQITTIHVNIIAGLATSTGWYISNSAESVDHIYVHIRRNKLSVSHTHYYTKIRPLLLLLSLWCFLKKNLNASRPSEHLPVRGKNVKTFLKKNQKAPRSSEHPPVRGGKMSKRLGGIIGCKYKTSSWHLKGFPDGSNIGSTV